MMDATQEEPARELAEELRAILENLSTQEIGAQQLVSACALARELRAQLQGPRRARWYEADGEAAKYSPSRAAETTRSPRSPDHVAPMEHSPIRGALNPIAPPVHVEVVRDDPAHPQCVEGRVTLGQAYEGVADAVHGGWVAAIFDDVLGAAQGLLDAPGVTAILRTRFRELTPLAEELCFRAWVHEHRGRRITLRATCHAGRTLTADAEAIFLKVDFGALRGRMRTLRAERQGRPA